MVWKRVFIVVLAASLIACASGSAFAQSVLEPSGASSHQFIDSETPSAPSSPTTMISRPDFGLLGLAMMWSQLVWLPASPLQMPSAFAMLAPGDRRWGLR